MSKFELFLIKYVWAFGGPWKTSLIKGTIRSELIKLAFAKIALNKLKIEQGVQQMPFNP